MHHPVCKRGRLALVLLLLAIPLPSLAMPAISCHCFTERSFDAAHPAAADPYFLASGQNSFFAIAFAIDKKSVVFKKQQGTPSDDLWIAHWVASGTGVSPDSLLETRHGSESWNDVLAPLRPAARNLGSRFIDALNARLPAARLAEAVVDELLIRFRLLGEGELKGMRQAGASNQESILAAVIGARTGKPAGSVYRGVKSGSGTWGALLQSAGIDSKNMPKVISGLISRH